MSSRRLTVGFDTSGINALIDSSSGAAHLIAGLNAGFHVFLPAIAVEEVISCPQSTRRELLLATCDRLLRSGSCLWPPHEILRRLILAYFRDQREFRWTRISMRAPEYETGVFQRTFTSEICSEQRSQQFQVQKDFAKMWTGLRPHLDAILESHPSQRPSNYHDALLIASAEGGVLFGFGRMILEQVIPEARCTETETETFMKVCPPFRAACHALVMAWFKESLKMRKPGEPRGPGRNDLLMATYLPYCDRFVTVDWAQEQALREISKEARLDADVLSFNEFDESFALAV